MNPQQRLVVIGGSTAVVVLLGLAYWLLRKEDEDEDDDFDDDHKSNKSKFNNQNELPDLNTSVASAGQFSSDIFVPKRIVGIIIGRGGENIKQLRNEFAVRLDFEKEENLTKAEKEDKKDRKLTIKGEREKVIACEQKVKQILAEIPELLETEILVPQESCGQIIGKGGQNIREMCNISGAKIQLERDSDPNLNGLKRVKLSGSSSQIEYAKLLVDEKVEISKKMMARDQLKVSHISDVNNHVPLSYEKLSLSEPNNNGYFRVFLSYCEDPNQVWLQPISKKSLELESLNVELKNLYEKMDTKEEQMIQGRRGKMCVAPFEDDQWYRAIIKSINRDRTAEILYIDYGNTSLVNMDSLKEIKTEHLVLPACATQFFLPIEPIGPWWSKENEEFFKVLVVYGQWHPLEAKIIGRKTIRGKELDVVELLDLNDSKKPQDICDAMVSAHKATYDEGFKTGRSSLIKVEIETLFSDLQTTFKETQSSQEEVVVPTTEIQVESYPDSEEVVVPTTEIQVESYPDSEEVVIPTTETQVESYLDSEDIVVPTTEIQVESYPDSEDIVVPTTEIQVESHPNSKEVVVPTTKMQVESYPDSEDIVVPTTEIQVESHPNSKEVVVPTTKMQVQSTTSFLLDNKTDSMKADESQEYVAEESTDSGISKDLEKLVDRQDSVGEEVKHASIQSQPSLDDSFVDIDIVGEAISAVVKEHIPSSPIHTVKSFGSGFDQQETPMKETSTPRPNEEDLDKTPLIDEKEVEEEEENDEEESELQRSLDETSKKNVAEFLTNSSMELARENLILIDESGEDGVGDLSSIDNESFYSVRSDVTITDTDNASFTTATDGLTPTKELSFSVPDLTAVSPSHSGSVKSSSSRNDLTTSGRSSRSSFNNSSKFEIQFIDEKTNRVMSRESLTASFDSAAATALSGTNNLTKQQKRLSAPPKSPGKETSV